MALSASSPSSSFNLTFFSFLIITFLLLLNFNTLAYAVANHTKESPPPPSPPPDSEKTSSAFKPGMAVVVGVLTTMFSLTFLLLLYIKHCNGAASDPSGTGYHYSSGATAAVAAPFAGRKNSGIDRSIVESLPIFRFGSLRGQKEGLDCAVCLAKFDSSEVLRLLPKCKHAFHVECVDTWLDAHSTCPLCRHRVDPEDILLVEDGNAVAPVHQHQSESEQCSERNETRRVSGRHSSVGEKEGGFLEIIVENETERPNGTSSFRRSLDSATCATMSRSRNNNNCNKEGGVMSVGVGWLVRPRKDGMLLVAEEREKEKERSKVRKSTGGERRLEHRIIVSPSPRGKQKQCGYGGLLQLQRWSDVQPSDLLYLTSEMIISNGARVGRNDNGGELGGSLVINTRSVSEITGLSRFVRNGNREEEERGRRREERAVSRWLGWISRTQTQPAVR